jgi:hypothetical protein
MKVQVVHKQQADGSVSHHARIRGGNGEIVWVTETYTRPEPAFRAVDLLTEMYITGVTAVLGSGTGTAGSGVGVGSWRPPVEEVWE